MAIIERIGEFIENQNISIRAFEKSISASDGMIRRALNNKTEIQSKWLTNISENYHRLNIDWLITGKGEMLKSEKVYIIQQDKTDAVAEPVGEYVHQENPDLSSLENASKNELIAMIKELIGVNNRNSISIEKMVETADRNSITLSRLVDVLYGEGLKGGNQEIGINVG